MHCGCAHGAWGEEAAHLRAAEKPGEKEGGQEEERETAEASNCQQIPPKDKHRTPRAACSTCFADSRDLPQVLLKNHCFSSFVFKRAKFPGQHPIPFEKNFEGFAGPENSGSL